LGLTDWLYDMCFVWCFTLSQTTNQNTRDKKINKQKEHMDREGTRDKQKTARQNNTPRNNHSILLKQTFNTIIVISWCLSLLSLQFACLSVALSFFFSLSLSLSSLYVLTEKGGGLFIFKFIVHCFHGVVHRRQAFQANILVIV
jgi:hypothetical protein